MITHEEWDRHAQIAAAHKHGEDHVTWYRFRRYGPAGTLLAGLTAVALGIRWTWTHLRLPEGHGGIPTGFWVLLVALALVTFYLFRPGRGFRTAASTIARVAVTGLLWLGMVVYAATVLI